MKTGAKADALIGESFLCARWKSVILRANRTGLLTFVLEERSEGSKGLREELILVLARIAKLGAASRRSARLRFKPV